MTHLYSTRATAWCKFNAINNGGGGGTLTISRVVEGQCLKFYNS